MVACFHGQASQKAFVYLAWLQCVKVSSTDIISMYSVIHISIPPIKELCSKMAPGEVGVSLP